MVAGINGGDAVMSLVEPTINLTMLQPAGGEGGADPLAGLVVTLAWIWLVGVPWFRFCWWLGHRPRRGTATGAVNAPCFAVRAPLSA